MIFALLCMIPFSMGYDMVRRQGGRMDRSEYPFFFEPDWDFKLPRDWNPSKQYTKGEFWALGRRHRIALRRYYSGQMTYTHDGQRIRR